VTPDRPDRRVSPRFAPRPGVAVDCQPGTALALLDLSATGARLYLSPRARSGSAVTVTLHPPGGGAAVRRSATVVWVHTDLGLACTVGVEFAATLSADDLAGLTEVRR
jgi:hypothetical protein